MSLNNNSNRKRRKKKEQKDQKKFCFVVECTKQEVTGFTNDLISVSMNTNILIYLKHWVKLNQKHETMCKKEKIEFSKNEKYLRQTQKRRQKKLHRKHYQNQRKDKILKQDEKENRKRLRLRKQKRMMRKQKKKESKKKDKKIQTLCQDFSNLYKDRFLQCLVLLTLILQMEQIWQKLDQEYQNFLKEHFLNITKNVKEKDSNFKLAHTKEICPNHLKLFDIAEIASRSASHL